MRTFAGNVVQETDGKVTGQVARKSSPLKLCRLKPELIRPICCVMSPEGKSVCNISRSLSDNEMTLTSGIKM